MTQKKVTSPDAIIPIWLSAIWYGSLAGALSKKLRPGEVITLNAMPLNR